MLTGALKLVTAPTTEPLTMTEAKTHLRVDYTDDDGLIANLITVTRGAVETVTRRALITQTWDWTLDAFPAGRDLIVPLPPLQSVTSITYVDIDGNSSTVSASDYYVDTVSEPGRIRLKSGTSWPSVTLREANGVTVRFVAGYGGINAVPARIRHAMLLMMGHLFENRENVTAIPGGKLDVIPHGAESLLATYRLYGW